MAQLNPISGDVEYNKNKAIENIKKANEINADLIVFPELFLLGYPIGDILTRYPYVVKQAEVALQEIKNNSGTQFDPAVVAAFEECFDEIISTIKQLDLIKYDD